MGITNVPALLQTAPHTSLASLSLRKYEIAPSEPLHDLKGHFANVIDETLHLLSGQVLAKVLKIKNTILKKDALRGSDFWVQVTKVTAKCMQ